MLVRPSLAQIQAMEPYSDFLASRQNEKTVDCYGRHLAIFHEWLEARGLTAMTAASKDVAQFIGALGRGYSRATILNYCHCLSSFYGYLVATEQIMRNPTAVFRTFNLRRPDRRPKPIDIMTEKKLVESLRHGTLSHTRISCVILLALYAGLRRDEIRTLEWSQVDFEGGFLTVKGKGDKIRTVVMHPKIRTPLYRLYCFCRYHFGLFPSRYVFRSPKSRENGTVSEKVIDDLFRRGKEWAGLQDAEFSLHGLRHTAATRMVAGGGTAFDVRDFLGHSSVSTSEIYVQTTEKQSQDAFRKAFGLLN